MKTGDSRCSVCLGFGVLETRWPLACPTVLVGKVSHALGPVFARPTSVPYLGPLRSFNVLARWHLPTTGYLPHHEHVASPAHRMQQRGHEDELLFAHE
jgi:hypothetical protein